MAQTCLSISTKGQGLYEITDAAHEFVRRVCSGDGLLTVFVRHTSCSLIVQENADPDVKRDLMTFFSRIAPPAGRPGSEWITHTTEGADDMPAHIKSALTSTSLGIPVTGGRLMLGTWQGIYLFEHRDQPHNRQVVLHLSA